LSYLSAAAAFDESTNTALFIATFHGKHSGDGGPVPPTGQEAHADYVYSLHLNDEGLVDQMVKVWNAPWTLRELGWA
jgi:hypothetical protein